MANTPKKWRVFHKQYGEMTVEAERFEKNGSGTTFFDADGNQVAAFGDQEVGTVIPAGTKGSDET